MMLASISTMRYRKGLLLLLISASMVLSCTAKEPLYYQMESLKLDDIHFQTSRGVLKFGKATISDLRSKYGKPLLDILISKSENGEKRSAIFEGLSATYYKKGGKVTHIEILSQETEIIGRVKVGKALDDVISALRGGILTEDKDSYYFVVMGERRESGIGYWIHFDTNARVKKIWIGTVSFAP